MFQKITFYLKMTTFPNQNTSVRRVTLLNILRFSLTSGLIKKTAHFSYLLCIQFVVMCYLVKIYEKNVISCRYVVRKGRSISIAFTDNCSYYCLIQHQDMKSETISMSLLRSVVLKVIGVSCTLNGPFC